jgi:hypothetical protein
MMDQGAHAGKGLTNRERTKFQVYQERAIREYGVSGIHFQIRVTEGAYHREEDGADIPEKFLTRGMINVFVTSSLSYDIDRERTGGCSIGPHRRVGRFPPDPYYKTFLGVNDAGEGTLCHEYAHHFTLDTRRGSSWAGNFWADFRNDYWLWEQRHGTAIPAFRNCVNSEWARLG